MKLPLKRWVIHCCLLIQNVYHKMTTEDDASIYGSRQIERPPSQVKYHYSAFALTRDADYVNKMQRLCCQLYTMAGPIRLQPPPELYQPFLQTSDQSSCTTPWTRGGRIGSSNHATLSRIEAWQLQISAIFCWLPRTRALKIF